MTFILEHDLGPSFGRLVPANTNSFLMTPILFF